MVLTDLWQTNNIESKPGIPKSSIKIYIGTNDTNGGEIIITVLMEILM